jgi:hypothetical protein
VLYNVCKYNRSKHFTEAETDDELSITTDDDHVNFNDKFSSYTEFNNLFE